MKIGDKWLCDDCSTLDNEVEIPQFNIFGSTDLCDKCESFYQLSWDEQKEYHNLSDKEKKNILDEVKNKGEIR